MSKHTPGPWIIYEFSSKDSAEGNGAETAIQAYADEDGENGATIANVNRWSYGDDPPTAESQANARLIAAAPELYEACKAFLGAIERTPCSCIPAYKDRGLTDPECARCHIDLSPDDIEKARNAIAKAAPGKGEK